MISIKTDLLQKQEPWKWLLNFFICTFIFHTTCVQGWVEPRAYSTARKQEAWCETRHQSFTNPRKTTNCMGNFGKPGNQNHMFFNHRKKLGYLEKIHTTGGRTSNTQCPVRQVSVILGSTLSSKEMSEELTIVWRKWKLYFKKTHTKNVKLSGLMQYLLTGGTLYLPTQKKIIYYL